MRCMSCTAGSGVRTMWPHTLKPNAHLSALRTYLILPLLHHVKKVLQGTVVDTPPLRPLNVCAGHGVSLAASSLPIGKDADIVPCGCRKSRDSWRLYRNVLRYSSPSSPASNTSLKQTIIRSNPG